MRHTLAVPDSDIHAVLADPFTQHVLTERLHAHGRPCPGCWGRSTPRHLLELIPWRGRNTKGKRACDCSTISGLGRKRKLGKRRASGRGEVPLRQGGPTCFCKEAPLELKQRRSEGTSLVAMYGGNQYSRLQVQTLGLLGAWSVRNSKPASVAPSE